MKKIFELNKNLVKINGNYLCLSDGFKYPPVGNYYWTSNGIYVAGTGNIYPADSRNIIFSTEFLQDSIPVLDLSGSELNELAEHHWKMQYIMALDEHTKPYIMEDFKSGYQKAKETFKYTEEDLRKAIEMARYITDDKETFTGEDISGCTEVCTYDWKEKYSDEEIINLLQQPKEIKRVEVEYIRLERIEKLLSIPLEKLSIIDDIGDKNCKNCSGHGCVDTGNEFGCIMDYCEQCYPVETPVTLPDGKIKCKVIY